MITGIKKTHKTTEIYFDEADKWTTVITYNTSLKNRLLAFSQEYPELCKPIGDDECGCLKFEVKKSCSPTAYPRRTPRNVRQKRGRR